jgi:signal transduction histidine kinase
MADARISPPFSRRLMVGVAALMALFWIGAPFAFAWSAAAYGVDYGEALVTVRVGHPLAVFWLMAALILTLRALARLGYLSAPENRLSTRALLRWGILVALCWLAAPALLTALTRRTPLLIVSSLSPTALAWFGLAVMGSGLICALLGARWRGVVERRLSRERALEVLEARLDTGVLFFSLRRPAQPVWSNAAGRQILTHPDAGPELLRLTARVAEGGRALSQRVALGESGRIALHIAPLDDGQICAIARPIQAEADPNAFYDRFIRRIVHDMRNPLAAIIAHAGNLRALEAELLGAGQGAEADTRPTLMLSNVAATAGVIEGEAQRLTRLVDSILFDARLSYVPPALEAVDLLDIIEDVYFQLDERAAREGKTLELETDLKAAPLDADRDMLVRALSNLVDNSLKYSAAGMAVRVSLDDQGDAYRLRVSDTGEGIPPELLPERIFEPLVRARPREGGSGLGLSIVKKIIDLHHGRINVESQSGVGTQMTLWLPK